MQFLVVCIICCEMKFLVFLNRKMKLWMYLSSLFGIFLMVCCLLYRNIGRLVWCVFCLCRKVVRCWNLLFIFLLLLIEISIVEVVMQVWVLVCVLFRFSLYSICWLLLCSFFIRVWIRMLLMCGDLQLLLMIMIGQFRDLKYMLIFFVEFRNVGCWC